MYVWLVASVRICQYVHRFIYITGVFFRPKHKVSFTYLNGKDDREKKSLPPVESQSLETRYIFCSFDDRPATLRPRRFRHSQMLALIWRKRHLIWHGYSWDGQTDGYLVSAHIFKKKLYTINDGDTICCCDRARNCMHACMDRLLKSTLSLDCSGMVGENIADKTVFMFREKDYES